jgi:hypothetical protein
MDLHGLLQGCFFLFKLFYLLIVFCNHLVTEDGMKLKCFEKINSIYFYIRLKYIASVFHWCIT